MSFTINKGQRRTNKIKEFYAEHGRLPLVSAKKGSKELKLYGNMQSRLTPSSPMYDIEFRNWVMSVREPLGKERVKAFYAEHGRLPHHATEPDLYSIAHNYGPSRGKRDPEFHAWMLARSAEAKVKKTTIPTEFDV